MLKRLLVLLLFASPSFAANTWYVDYSGGSDSNAGTTSGAAWKHAPGDDACTVGVNCHVTPASGDTIVFKGGVTYSGTSTGAWSNSGNVRRVVAAISSGTNGNPITYISGNDAAYNWGTGQAILDGGGPGAGAAVVGFGVHAFHDITINGLMIQNIGVPTTDAAGLDVYSSGGTSADRITLTKATIHDVNYGASYTRGYGVEVNHANYGLYEKNEIYNTTDKSLELSGNGTDGGTDTANNIVRLNYFHDAQVHCIVFIATNSQFYNNLLSNCQNGASFPNPGYCLKVDQGHDNQIFNNVCYKTASGWGVLNGRNNLIANNTVYGIGLNGGGEHQGDDEACIVLWNNDNAWGAAGVSGNTVENNICYDVSNANTQVNSKLVMFNKDTGSNNLVKNNVLIALSGDTSATTNRVRWNNKASGSGSQNYLTIANFESNFNTDFGGSGNVASGNVVSDPLFNGGTFASFTPFPTGFNGGFTDLNQTSFHLMAGSPALVAGLDLTSLGISALDTDLAGVARPNGSAWDIGAYNDSTVSCTPDHLTFTSQPSNANIGVAIGTVTVKIYDASNNFCNAATNTITLANHGGTCTGMTLGGTTSGAATSGAFTTTNNTENASGSCQLDATATMITTATSNAFTINATSASGVGRSRRQR